METEKIMIRKVAAANEINDGLIYGAFNSYGTPIGKRFRTAEECRKAFFDAGFRNIAMPEGTCDSFTITGTVFANIEAESPEDAVRKEKWQIH